VKVRTAISLVMLTVVFLGCTPSLYLPNATNIPLPDNKYELKVGGGLSSAGGYFEGSYAIDSHIVLMANFAKYAVKDSNTFSKDWIGELAGGYYSHIGKHGRFEILGGYGIGNSSSNEYYYPPGTNFFNFYTKPPFDRFITNTNFGRFIIQSDIGASAKYGEIGLSAKMSFLFMQKPSFEKQNIGSPNNMVTADTLFLMPSTEAFFEPSIFLNFGLKNVKFHFNLGLSLILGPDKNFWEQHSLYPGAFFAEGITVYLFRKD